MDFTQIFAAGAVTFAVITIVILITTSLVLRHDRKAIAKAAESTCIEDEDGVMRIHHDKQIHGTLEVHVTSDMVEFVMYNILSNDRICVYLCARVTFKDANATASGSTFAVRILSHGDGTFSFHNMRSDTSSVVVRSANLDAEDLIMNGGTVQGTFAIVEGVPKSVVFLTPAGDEPDTPDDAH